MLSQQFIGLMYVCLCTILISCQTSTNTPIKVHSKLQLDQEKMLEPNKALNAGTQSINRYQSELRSLSNIKLDYQPNEQTIDVHISDETDNASLLMKNLKLDYLLPILPYQYDSELNDFDQANLVLAEYARNGIRLSLQQQNKLFGYFHGSETLFNDRGEYSFDGSNIIPNPKVKPVRMSIVNNCLHPGLWEINATDAVGEMYHAWFTIPQSDYFSLLKSHLNIENEQADLQHFFDSESWEGIPVELDRLRDRKELIQTTNTQIAVGKQLGAYSSQDSRRKVQRGFHKIFREGKQIEVDSFGQLKEADIFRLYSFIPPGIYDHTQTFDIPYQPEWEEVSIYEVEPKMSYGIDHKEFSKDGCIEIILKNKTNNQAIIIGNIPIRLLVFSEDYKIPAFGAGVLSSSENIERRYLRLKEGPAPHYAYLVDQADQPTLLNNHQIGYEQVYLRPFEKEGEIWIRMTVVSYERIVDLLEFEFPVKGELAQRIRQASNNYTPPIYEVYVDDNTL